MFRKDLLELLHFAPRRGDSRRVVTPAKAGVQALHIISAPAGIPYLLKRVRHTGYRVTITPARCRETWINPPLIHIEAPEPP